MNSFLDDQTPESLLYTDPDWVIDAARDTAAEMHHWAALTIGMDGKEYQDQIREE